MNEEYEKFFNACIAKLGVGRTQCRMDHNYCRILTSRGWVVHYEWCLAQNNKLEVALHFESNSRALNQRRYGTCAPIIDTLKGKLEKNTKVIAGGRGKKWFQITISRNLDFKEKEAVIWAVSMMHQLRDVFGKTVSELA